MRAEQRLLELIDLVYRTTLDRKLWNDVAKALSEEFGGAAISITMQSSGAGSEPTVFRVGISNDYNSVLVRLLLEWEPYLREVGDEASKRFVRMSEHYPSETLPGSMADREYLSPQGLAPEPPILTMTSPDLMPMSSNVVIWRRKDGPPITDAQLGLADQLLPHIGRSIQITSAIGGSEQAQIALHEVVDRIPTGVVIVNAQCKPVFVNRMGHRIIEGRDGFTIENDEPKAIDRETTRRLRTLLDSAVNPAPGHEMAGGGFMALPRPSGLRPYPVLVTPILGKSTRSAIGDAAAVMFVSDPEFREVTITNVLSDVYHLTPAEAELAQLLARGCSLEEAAQARGVTLNTARSQLKQVFSKTDTNRQGELLQLLLSGVATIDEAASGNGNDPSDDA